MADFYIFRAILPLQDTMGFSQHKYKMQKFSGFEERTNKKQNRKKSSDTFSIHVYLMKESILEVGNADANQYNIWTT